MAEGGGARVGVLRGGGAGLEWGSRGQASELTDFSGDRIQKQVQLRRSDREWPQLEKRLSSPGCGVLCTYVAVLIV